MIFSVWLAGQLVTDVCKHLQCQIDQSTLSPPLSKGSRPEQDTGPSTLTIIVIAVAGQSSKQVAPDEITFP